MKRHNIIPMGNVNETKSNENFQSKYRNQLSPIEHVRLPTIIQHQSKFTVKFQWRTQ